MRRFYELSMNSGRKTDLVEEELDDDFTEETEDSFDVEDDFSYHEDDFDDEEPYEREYCD